MNYAGTFIEGEDGKLLFQLRDNKSTISNPNKWAIFGGGIEKKENPKETLIRELNEELNLSVDEKDLKLISKINLIFKKHFIFKTKIKKNQKLTLREGSSMKFFSKKEILKQKNLYLPLRVFIWLHF